MLDIVATYIVLYTLYIVNNEGIENEWVVEVANKLAKKKSLRKNYEQKINSRNKDLKLLK